MTYAQTLLLLSIFLALVVAMLLFAVVRMGAALRTGARRSRQEGAEAALVTSALQEAVERLRHQERLLTERAEASERLSSEIISSMTAGLLVVGAEGEVRTLNPAARRLLELPENTTTSSFRLLLSRSKPLAAVIDECLQAQKPIVRRTLEMRARGSAGTAASHLGVTVSPIVTQGELQGAICLFTDLSAIAELEEQLRLKESLATLGELTAGIAHEFRNGLATIHGYGRLLDPEKLPLPYRTYVEGIRQETAALNEIVTQFLNFARPASLTLTAVDLRAVIERAADEIRGEAAGRGGGVEIVGEFPQIEGDEVLLRQAFSNLCRNALEACIEGERAPEIRIEGTAQRSQSTTRVTVSDNGPGLSVDLGDRIFQPFFTTRANGIGLGLALVQKIVVTHNGRVVASNVPDSGASFAVTLPLRSAT